MNYSDILTTWENGRIKQGAVTAILTGDHPDEELVGSEKIRYAAIDGKLDALFATHPRLWFPG